MNAITFEIGLMSLVRSSNFDENFKITRLDDKTLKALVRKKITYYNYLLRLLG